MYTKTACGNAKASGAAESRLSLNQGGQTPARKEVARAVRHGASCETRRGPRQHQRVPGARGSCPPGGAGQREAAGPREGPRTQPPPRAGRGVRARLAPRPAVHARTRALAQACRGRTTGSSSARTHTPARPGPRGLFSPFSPPSLPPSSSRKFLWACPPHRVIQSRCQSPCPLPLLPPAVGSASRGVSPKLYKLSFPPSPLDTVSGRGGGEGRWRHQQQRPGGGCEPGRWRLCHTHAVTLRACAPLPHPLPPSLAEDVHSPRVAHYLRPERSFMQGKSAVGGCSSSVGALQLL